MKITIKEPTAGADEEIIVLCHNINPELLRVLYSLKTPNNMLVANIDNEIHRVNPLDIFYIESVDRKTFLYCENDVYESKQKLYELEEPAIKDFLRISKSVLVNVNKIKTLIPSFSGNGEAVLLNNERLVISRRYINDLKETLGM